MKRIREYTELFFFLLLITITILSAVNIAKTNKIKSQLDMIKDADKVVVTEEVKTETVENRNECPHDWKVIDRDNDWDSSLVTCDKCGEIKLVDYRNHRIKKAE